MPILSPDRMKGRIAAIAMQRLAPANPLKVDMKRFQPEDMESEGHEEAEENAKMALRAMYSAMQSGDFDAAYTAYCTAHKLVDLVVEGEEY